MSSTSIVRVGLSAPQALFTFIKSRPIVAGVIAIALAGGGYYTYTTYTSTEGETKYVFGEVERGMLRTTVSGSGQVSAESQLELTAKVSGDITSLSVKNGDTIKRGALIASIDSRTAQKAVRDAQVNLESAKLALQKLEQPATTLTLTQAKNALTDAQNSLESDYDDGFNEVSDTFLALPAVMSGVDAILYDNTVTASQDNAFAYADMIDDIEPRVNMFRDDAIRKYTEARAQYDALLVTYKATSRFSEKAALEKLILETYDMTKTVAEATKSLSDFLNLVNDNLVLRDRTIPTILTTHRDSLSGFISTGNTQLVALLSIKDGITSAKQSIEEKAEALRDLEDGTDKLDLDSQRLVVKQRENTLRDAQEDLADYSLRAPFDGTVAKLNVKRADRVSSGTSIATFITANAVAEISLNEIDAAHVQVGQKAELTFDAVEGLRIEGSVVEIDTVGTVSSGVVTYTVTIGFETDTRIKPGMTVNADIITQTLENVLLVPAGAVKSERNNSYVETIPGSVTARDAVTSDATPTQVTIEVGATNDTQTEVLSGLNEGDVIIVRTISGSASAAQQAPNIFQATGARTPGGGGGTGGSRTQVR